MPFLSTPKAADHHVAIAVDVIIPTWNEAENLRRLLPRLRAMAGVRHIIVCDGGSRDQTVVIAQKAGAIVTSVAEGAAANRGAQLIAGVAALREREKLDESGGRNRQALWFLHADALPHAQSGREIGRALQNPRIIGGNFRLRFDNRFLAARLFETVARAQRRLGIYYGDSGLWMRSETYEELGGFQSWPLFEDFDLARRLEQLARRRKQRTACLPLPLIVSSRRFEQQPMRVLRLWIELQIRFWLGADPAQLAQKYRRRD